VNNSHEGVLITAGPISKAGWETATNIGAHVVLIDGDRMAHLMIEFGIGVSHESLLIPKLDRDYFEE
jgi:restriction system protein